MRRLTLTLTLPRGQCLEDFLFLRTVIAFFLDRVFSIFFFFLTQDFFKFLKVIEYPSNIFVCEIALLMFVTLEIKTVNVKN